MNLSDKMLRRLGLIRNAELQTLLRQVEGMSEAITRLSGDIHRERIATEKIIFGDTLRRSLSVAEQKGYAETRHVELDVNYSVNIALPKELSEIDRQTIQRRVEFTFAQAISKQLSEACNRLFTGAHNHSDKGGKNVRQAELDYRPSGRNLAKDAGISDAQKVSSSGSASDAARVQQSPTGLRGRKAAGAKKVSRAGSKSAPASRVRPAKRVKAARR